MKIGSLVECIHTFKLRSQHEEAGVKAPIEGEAYTIRNIKVEHEDNRLYVYIVLEEIVNPKLPCTCGRRSCKGEDEPYFDIESFTEVPDIEDLLGKID